MSSLEVKPLCGKFEDCLPMAASMSNSRVFLFLGSSLGNYNDVEIINLYRLVTSYMTTSTATDRFLVGVDTPHSINKPANLVKAAYNDARGITAAFTLNTLRHLILLPIWTLITNMEDGILVKYIIKSYFIIL
jgi:uncharacterized SAM-dependent methyltransferase